MSRTLVILLSLLAFAIFTRFDFSILLFSRSDWLLAGDMAQSYVGWLQYWNQDSFAPALTGYIYPLGSSLFTTDSIPFYAILMKLILPSSLQDPQIFGLWFLICFLLQGQFAYGVAKSLGAARNFAWLISFLIMLTPALFFRVGHMALFGHWVVLACIQLSLIDVNTRSTKTLLWMLLSLISVGIHAYFVLFCLTFAMTDLFRFLWVDRRRALIESLVSLAFLVIILGVTYTSMHFFGLTGQAYLSGRLHFFTADLLMPINPAGYMRLSPELWQLRMGQYEAFSYLGILPLVMIIVIIVRSWGTVRKKLIGLFRDARIGPILAAAALLWFFSLGEHIRLYGAWLAKLDFVFDPIRPLLGAFRSNGRFIWAAMYLIIFLTSVKFFRQYTSKKIWGLSFFLIGVHIIDLSKLGVIDVGKAEVELLEFPVSESVRKIDIYPLTIPATACDSVSGDDSYIPYALFAMRHGLSINSGARAHPDQSLISEYCANLRDRLTSGQLESDTIYVIREKFHDLLADDLRSYCLLYGQDLICWKPQEIHP